MGFGHKVILSMYRLDLRLMKFLLKESQVKNMMAELVDEAHRLFVAVFTLFALVL